jgi:hypothetical protein
MARLSSSVEIDTFDRCGIGFNNNALGTKFLQYLMACKDDDQ